MSTKASECSAPTMQLASSSSSSIPSSIDRNSQVIPPTCTGACSWRATYTIQNVGRQAGNLRATIACHIVTTNIDEAEIVGSATVQAENGALLTSRIGSGTHHVLHEAARPSVEAEHDESLEIAIGEGERGGDGAADWSCRAWGVVSEVSSSWNGGTYRLDRRLVRVSIEASIHGLGVSLPPWGPTAP